MDNSEINSTKITEEKDSEKESWITSWPSLIVFCIILPIAFRSVVYAPFHIPSGSMKSTLLVGDFLFVSKNAYGYSKYSFPFGIPFLDTRYDSAEPERGDVVVFRPPPTPFTDYIKRVIGLPGDKIQVKNGIVYLNEQALAQREIDMFMEEDRDKDGTSYQLKRSIETLPNGVSYYILDHYPDGRLDNTDVFVVPENHYFMMGDNRDHSADSRTTKVGFVPRENLVGRADIIFLSSKTSLWKVWLWFDNFREGRWFKSIQF